MRWKPSGSWSLALSLLAAGAAAQAAEAPSLEGVWGGTRIFGPAVQGRLEIARVNGAWRARIDPTTSRSPPRRPPRVRAARRRR